MKLSLGELSTFSGNIALSHIKVVFEKRLSTGCEAFLCLESTLFVLISVFTLKETICLKL